MYNIRQPQKINNIIPSTAAVGSPGVTLSSLDANIYGKSFTIESLTDDVFITNGGNAFKVTGIVDLTYPAKDTKGTLPQEEYYVYGTGTYQILVYDFI